jgi:protein O-mannosyl-transferase
VFVIKRSFIVFSLCLALLLSLAAWVYAPGTSGPALLDDYSSLGSLENVGESPEQAFDYILGDESGALGRSVSMATFVLEQALGAGDIATTKRVNIAIHLFNGFLVALLLLLLGRSKSMPFAPVAAVLFAGVWVLAPLQVSTVLYLVQRMAMLAATFTLLSLVFYVHWRRSLGKGLGQLAWLIAAFCALIVGVFAKENAIVAIPLILVLEVCGLQFLDDRGQIISWLRRLTYTLITFGSVVLMILLLFYWDWLSSRYWGREFSLEERVFTQARILWDYVGQFLLPDVQRMGIFHDDVVISTSLYSPISTLLSLVAWCLVIAGGLAFLLVPGGGVVAYGLLFYPIAHTIESTVWPLELYFEHRNYLPSIGLSILMLGLYGVTTRQWRETASPLLAWLGVYIVYLVLLTSSQVQIWSSAPLLAMNHVIGHPDSARANREMATQLAVVGAREGALEYSSKAYAVGLSQNAAGDEHYGDYILRNVALACLSRKPLNPDEYEELGRLNPSRPLGDVSTMSTVVKLRQTNACKEFEWGDFMEYLSGLYLQEFDASQASANMWSALAMLANAEQHWEHAYQFNKRNLVLAPGNIRGLLMQLHFSTALGKEEEARGLITELQQLEEAGKLNQGERDTLALYEGN